jgi:hypothetical protein
MNEINRKNILLSISPIPPFLLKGCNVLSSCDRTLINKYAYSSFTYAPPMTDGLP